MNLLIFILKLVLVEILTLQIPMEMDFTMQLKPQELEYRMEQSLQAVIQQILILIMMG